MCGHETTSFLTAKDWRGVSAKGQSSYSHNVQALTFDPMGVEVTRTKGEVACVKALGGVCESMMCGKGQKCAKFAYGIQNGRRSEVMARGFFCRSWHNTCANRISFILTLQVSEYV